MKSDIKFELTQVKIDIQNGIRDCSDRGLLNTVKWLSELNFALRDHKLKSFVNPDQANQPDDDETYLLAKSYFDCQEYDRAAHYLENSTCSKSIFLHRYSQYLSCEKKRQDSATEGSTENAEAVQVLLDLLSFFKANKNHSDGFLLYLQGVILKKLDLRQQATTALVSAVKASPILWAAWVELASLCPNLEAIEGLDLPQHWMYAFFTAHVFVELKLTDHALEAYTALTAAGFHKSTYVTAQMAIAHHDRRDVDTSLSLFRELYQSDPYRLDNWDVYSHLLYLKEKKMELANLAQRAVSIDKYRAETCCVIGNYYSLRSEHQKAVVYFQRALSLDAQYLSAWILMGHEFIELQNSNAAIQCYRQAIEVNRNDYRAWNGLGQAYEILGLNGYCIYYYSKAAQLKPDDSRMLVSLGEAYEKMDKVPNALKCYYRAHSTGDIEGMALFKLARLYERLSMSNSAAAAYTAACQDPGNANSKELPTALKYLAHYYLKLGLLEHAAHYAYKCLDYETTKEEGKALLKTISEKRASGPCTPIDKLPSDRAGVPETPVMLVPLDTPTASPLPNPDTFSTPVSMAMRKTSPRYKM